MSFSQQMDGRLCFAPRFDFSQVLGDRKLVSASIGPAGEAVLLAVSAEYEREPFGKEERKEFAIFPLSKAKRHYPAVYIYMDDNGVSETELGCVESAFPYVQPLPGGEILIVGARCHYCKGDPEQNAAVYSKTGELRRQFVLGDGINGVQTTADGSIWVSYFDEGIFGNFGWDKPLGASGLVSFDLKGRIIWEFKPPQGIDTIADCYAFNVCANTVWACYYTEFPLVCVDSHFQVSAWKNQVYGANAIAVSASHVLHWGGYKDKRTRSVLQTFGGAILKNRREVQIEFSPGLDAGTVTFIGRGSVLHAFSNNKWFTLDISKMKFADAG